MGTEEQQRLLSWETCPGSALPLFLLTHPRVSNFDLNRDQSGHETFFLPFPPILNLPYEHTGPPWHRTANPNHGVVWFISETQKDPPPAVDFITDLHLVTKSLARVQEISPPRHGHTLMAAAPPPLRQFKPTKQKDTKEQDKKAFGSIQRKETSSITRSLCLSTTNTVRW